jgi:hypothetical protein
MNKSSMKTMTLILFMMSIVVAGGYFFLRLI